MRTIRSEAVVAGHICLDLIPSFAPGGSREDWMVPGRLVAVGPATVATGGAVSNTGQALHNLGASVTLMGKVGSDVFGREILRILRLRGERLAEQMIVDPSSASSYTLVISPPGVDRIFFHSSGANDTFASADLPRGCFGGVRLLHFGYPPLMRRMYLDEGAELECLFAGVRGEGATTSLDMAMVDPDSEAGQVDWAALLRRVLPQVDLCLPSLDELLFMLRDEPSRPAPEAPEGERLSWAAETLLGMGAGAVLLKLGAGGAYLRTAADPARWRAMGRAAPEDAEPWIDRELLASCFQVEVAGTTGAGDTTIAGFLASFLRGLPPGECLRHAVAVGACCVEAPDATSGVPGWERLCERLSKPWKTLPRPLPGPGWKPAGRDGLWVGPHDRPDAVPRN